MKIYPKRSKTDRASDDFYFGNYGEIPIAISSATINENGVVGDKLHYHKKGYEFYLTIQGSGLLEIEGKEVELDQDVLAMVEPGEKHKIKSAIKTPFSFIAISNIKDKDDKFIAEE
jgi:mannose-6-phosphate isomerase-like protein (cupin superfamily)